MGSQDRKEDQIMLWTIAVVLVILWLLGFLSGYTVDYFIHIPLFFAVIVMLIHIEKVRGCSR
jgi:type III secretory pathway component EscV